MYFDLVPGEGGHEVGLVTLGDGTSKQEEKSSNVEPEKDLSHFPEKYLSHFPEFFLSHFPFHPRSCSYFSILVFFLLTNDFSTLPQSWQGCKGVN